MIGRATASLAPRGHRLARRLLGTPNIDTRQKWSAVWPVLARLPRTPLRVLDAGSGDGSWTVELAARRPAWHVVGIDRDTDCIDRAARTVERLGMRSVEFHATDFLGYQPHVPFDVVLSVSSAHYLVADGHGERIFARFAAWLAPGGRLVLHVPRRRGEVPALELLPPPFAMRELFGAAELAALCTEAGLEMESLTAVSRRAGTLAKQLARLAGASRAGRAIAYPVQVALLAAERAGGAAGARAKSSALLAVARRDGADSRRAPNS